MFISSYHYQLIATIWRKRAAEINFNLKKEGNGFVKRSIPAAIAHVQVWGSNISEYETKGHEATGAMQNREEPFHVSFVIS
jgi:uncharacterized protein YdaT